MAVNTIDILQFLSLIIYVSVELSNISFSYNGIFFHPKNVNTVIQLQIFWSELLSFKVCEGILFFTYNLRL